jgi:cold shock CspA family protein
VNERVDVRGKMLWFNEEKERGVIEGEDGERIAVTGDAFEGGPPEGRCAGRLVSYDLAEGADEPTAARVSLVEEAIPERARRRSRS